jgi:hypothetical protein
MNNLRRLESHSQMVLMRHKPGVVGMANQDTRMIYFYDVDDDGQLPFLFFIHPASITLLRHHYDVLLIDATYKQTVTTCLSCTSLAAQTRASHLMSDLHLLRQRRLKTTPSLSGAFVDSILTTSEVLANMYRHR